jgi:glyoxylase-like metal-dependent hydrolase (beta-lactamase superfamily II)
VKRTAMHCLLGLIFVVVPAFGTEPDSPSTMAAREVKIVQLSEHVELIEGIINGLRITDEESSIVVYGDARFMSDDADPQTTDVLLLTHVRRDVLCAAEPFFDNPSIHIAVPSEQLAALSDPGAFWSRFRTARFNDTSHQTSCVPVDSKMNPDQLIVVETTDEPVLIMPMDDYTVHAISTPGFMRGAVTYLIEVDGLKIACCGDLMYGNGQLLNLYDLQDSLPVAQIGGYHGYAARTGATIDSLRAIAAWEPDIIVPARGEIVRDDATTVANETILVTDMLIERLQAVYRNYLEMISIRWYFGEERMAQSAETVFGDDPIEPMPVAETLDAPDWLIDIGNTRVILSDTGDMFVIDCGGERQAQQIMEMQAESGAGEVTAMFITHYHADHTNYAGKAARAWDCPVYCTHQQQPVLERPGDFRLPCLTPNPIQTTPVEDGHVMRWNEFRLTIYYYPGQTLWHDAMLVEKIEDIEGEERVVGEPVFLCGDSFGPTGPDDYCLWNRNILKPGRGYFFCLDFLRTLPEGTMIVNQHIVPAFRYTPEQIDFMEANLQERIEVMSELFPWEDANFGIDSRWARFTPYGLNASSGETIDLELFIWNHGPDAEECVVELNPPKGWSVAESDRVQSRTIAGDSESKFTFKVQIPANWEEEWGVATADVALGDMRLIGWTEALIELESREEE